MNPLVWRVVPVAVAVLVLALFPSVGGKFEIALVTKIMILAIFALSLELLVGQTGLVCFGHAAFLGIAVQVGSIKVVAPAPAILGGIECKVGVADDRL